MPTSDESKLESPTLPPFKKRGIFDASVIEHRQRVAAAEPMIKPADVPFADVLVSISDKVKIPVRIYTPPLKKAPYPTFFYIPGTAFVAHESKFTRVICSHICMLAKCQVVVINHRLAPENLGPTAFQDSYEVMKAFVEKEPWCNLVDRSRIIIGGYSSGGNIALSMAIQARKEGIPVAMQILLSPEVDLSRSLVAYKKFEDQDTDISEEFVNWYLSLYIPEGANDKDPLISPFWNKKSDLQRLPPTAIVLAERDRFRSDAEALYEKLGKVGVYAKRLMLEGETHAYAWHKLEVTEKVADILQPICGERTIPRLSSSLHVVKPRLTTKEDKKNVGKKEQEYKSVSTTIRAKL